MTNEFELIEVFEDKREEGIYIARVKCNAKTLACLFGTVRGYGRSEAEAIADAMQNARYQMEQETGFKYNEI